MAAEEPKPAQPVGDDDRAVIELEREMLRIAGIEVSDVDLGAINHSLEPSPRRPKPTRNPRFWATVVAMMLNLLMIAAVVGRRARFGAAIFMLASCAAEPVSTAWRRTDVNGTWISAREADAAEAECRRTGRPLRQCMGEHGLIGFTE